MITLGLFLNFWNTFDMIRKPQLLLIKNYLENRYQFVSLN